MIIPEYVTIEEVQRVCAELGFRDWTGLTEPSVTLEEADTILKDVNVQKMNIAIEDFRQGSRG